MDLSTKDDPDFWTQIMTLRDPAWRELDEIDLIDLKDDIFEAVHEMASRISLREQDYRLAGQEVPDAVVSSPDHQLATLHVLYQVQRVVDELAANTAKNAGHTGASYTKLGTAWGGITRQSARVRWPGAVSSRAASPDAIPLQYADGSAVINHSSQDNAWWFAATGADEEFEESSPSFATSAEAIAAATEFLLSHARSAPLPIESVEQRKKA
jgi:hypothetical protein